MINEKLYIDSINSNDDLRLLKPNEALNIENCRVAISVDGRDKRIENIPSTLLISNPYLPAGVNTIFGSTPDPNRRRLLYCNYNASGNHAIYCYDIPSGNFYQILLDSQVNTGLNFNLAYPIDRNIKVIGDLLFFTDNFNEPRCINIEAGIKANHPGYVTNTAPYSFPLDYTNITLIKRPPAYSLKILKAFGVSIVGNRINIQPFQFTYYYDFYDHTKSALAPYSDLANYNLSNENYNYILIQVPLNELIPQDVSRINLVAKYGNYGKSFIINTFDKANATDLLAINGHNSGLFELTFNFDNSSRGQALDDVFSVNNQDFVPLTVRTLELAKNRLFAGNILSGYNSATSTSLTVTLNTVAFNLIVASTPLFKSRSSYKITTQFLDRYRRKGGATQKNVTFVIPDKYFGDIVSLYTSYLTWTLDNTNALVEIPDYAYYYQIIITKNQTVQFFLEGFTQDTSYATKDINGVYDFTPTVYDLINTAAIAVDISALFSDGIGYTFNDGDMANYRKNDGTNYTLPVIGQSGNYVLLKASNIGAISNSAKFTIPATTGCGASAIEQMPLNLTATYVYPHYSVQSSIHQVADAVETTNNWNFHFENSTAFSYTFNVVGKIVIKANLTETGSLTFYLTEVRYDNSKRDFPLAAPLTSITAGQIYTISVNMTIAVPYDSAVSPAKQIVAQIGSSMAGAEFDIISGNLTFSQASDANLIEIYTPYVSNTEEPFYECSPVFDVLNPTTNARRYATVTGNINGDVYPSLQPDTTTTGIPIFYIMRERMNPNNLYWRDWQRNLGWINVIDYIGQQQEKNSIVFSDTYIFGTKTNGLNKFQFLNKSVIDSDNGPISKLILTNKLSQELGTVMLCICQNGPLSLYLGETQLVSQTGNAYVAQSTGVIGTINPHKGNYGTVHPESTIDYLGEVFWWDEEHGSWIQYADNGVEALNYGMSRYFKKFQLRYQAQGKTDRIISCIDPLRKHLMTCMPATETTDYPLTLPSTTSKSKFDFYDGQQKIVFFDCDANQWKYNIGILPEWLEFAENKVFAFVGGQLYQHEAGSDFNNFYGTQLPARIAIVARQNPNLIRDLFNIAIEGNCIPDYTLAYSDNPNVQVTDLVAADIDINGNAVWNNHEGIQKASFFRDRLSPNVAGSPEQKMYEGDFIKSPTIQIMMEYQQYLNRLIINFINIGYEESGGHASILDK